MLPQFLLFIGSILFLRFLLVNRYSKSKTLGHLKPLPGPWNVPLVGAAIQILFQILPFYRDHCEKIHALCARYGKIMGFRVGFQNYVCVEDYDTVKEIMTSPNWVQRFPDTDLYKEHTFGKNLGLMWSSGENHREVRRFSSRALKNFGFGEMKSADVFLCEELNEFTLALDKDRQNNDNEIHMRKYFKIPTFNILWRVMSGERLSYDNKELHRIIHYVEDIAELQVGADMEWSFPILRWIPGVSKINKKKPSFNGVEAFFRNILQKRLQSAEYRYNQNDFMDSFLHRIEDEQLTNPKEPIYTDEQFIATCSDLLYGGLDTTANSLEFGILYMMLFPEVQCKVRAEIHMTIGKHDLPSSNDRCKMPYTEATMLEIFRHANIVPVNGRCAIQDTSLKGYFIRKNTLAGINLTAVHMSEEIWGDPCEFRPERFLDENNHMVNDDKIFPFGAGKRLCLGYTMAKMIWLYFFVRLLQRYKFERSPKHPKLSTIPKGGIANTAQPFYSLVSKLE